MRKALFFLIVIIFFAVFSLSCGGKKTEISLDEASSDETLYKLGEEHLKKDPEKARLYFRQVIDSFPKSFYAQRAKLAIADSYFKKGDEGSMILATAEYREFISLFPYSPDTAYAQYQIGMTYFKKALKPGRDQTKTWQALAEFKKVVTNYPLSEQSKLADEKIKECEEKLAKHISEIGHFYYRRNAFKAAENRLTEIITTFPNYSKMDEVYFYLADSYYKERKIDQSLPYFTKLISDFPKSKYAEKAKKRVEEINKKK
jgi:outer membrane protein assembly factor BamD